MLAFVLLVAFVLIQVWRPENATVPPRIFMQRTIAGAFWVSCCNGAHQALIGRFELPLLFIALTDIGL